VCRDVQLLRVEVSVLVSGRDEVGDAVHGVHCSECGVGGQGETSDSCGSLLVWRGV
jgi:hypothetical protein